MVRVEKSGQPHHHHHNHHHHHQHRHHEHHSGIVVAATDTIPPLFLCGTTKAKPRGPPPSPAAVVSAPVSNNAGKPARCRGRDPARRKESNRVAAQRSRNRKKAYLEDLELKCGLAQTENEALRQRVRSLELQLALHRRDSSAQEQSAPHPWALVHDGMTKTDQEDRRQLKSAALGISQQRSGAPLSSLLILAALVALAHRSLLLRKHKMTSFPRALLTTPSSTSSPSCLATIPFRTSSWTSSTRGLCPSSNDKGVT